MALAPGAVAAELLPELLALEEVFAAEASWARTRGCSRTRAPRDGDGAARRPRRAGSQFRAAALLEGAAREYGASGSSGRSTLRVRGVCGGGAGVARRGVGEEDEEAKDAAPRRRRDEGAEGGGGDRAETHEAALEELEVRRR